MLLQQASEAAAEKPKYTEKFTQGATKQVYFLYSVNKSMQYCFDWQT